MMGTALSERTISRRTWGTEFPGHNVRGLHKLGVANMPTTFPEIQATGRSWVDRSMAFPSDPYSYPRVECHGVVPVEEPVELSDTAFAVQAVSHNTHSHFSLKPKQQFDDISALLRSEDIRDPEVQDALKKNLADLIKKDQEGCPCCNAGLDFDEFAAALIELLQNSSGTHDKAIFAMANFESASHWGISLGIAAPLAIIGLTAAYRNIKGCWSNHKKIKTAMKELDKILNVVDQYNLPDISARLRAFKKTLKYSKFDTEFNFFVPGLVNGGASTAVLATTVVNASPVALAFMAAYGTLQVGRNTYDLCRTWHHHIPESSESVENTPSVSDSHKVVVKEWGTISRASQVEEKVRIHAMQRTGTKKVNEIGKRKRRFFKCNIAGFASLAAGSLLTLISLPALALGVGSLMLPIGLGLLGAGALSTGIMNNIWPQKFKPRNGDLGVNRLVLDQERTLEEIGRRKSMKTVLKRSRDNHLSFRWGRRFRYQVLTALPFGSNKGQRLRHKDNLKQFSKGQDSLAKGRSLTLQQLVSIHNGEPAKKINNDLASQWQACKTLGIESDILNVMLKEFNPQDTVKANDDFESNLTGNVPEKKTHKHHHHHHFHWPWSRHHHHGKHDHDHSNDGHCGSGHSCGHGPHSEDEFKNELLESGCFDVTDHTITLKPLNTLTRKQRNSLEKAMDFYLHFEFIEKLRYEQYGLNDYYWGLASEA